MSNRTFYDVLDHDKEKRFFANFKYRVEILLDEVGGALMGNEESKELANKLTSVLQEYYRIKKLKQPTANASKKIADNDFKYGN